MASNQDQSKGLLDNVFELAFTPKKKEGPRRPIDLRGITPSDELTKNLIEFVSSPMTQAAQSTAGILDSTFGSQGVLKFKLDSIQQSGYDGDAGDIKLKVKDMKKFISNPGQFIKKANDAAKKQRASMLLMGGVGELYSSWAVRAFAKKNGMSTSEAKALGIAAREKHNSAENREIIGALTEIATLKAAGNLTQAKQLSVSLHKQINKLTNSDEFFAITDKKQTKSLTVKLPGLVLVDAANESGARSEIAKLTRAKYINNGTSAKIFKKLDQNEKLTHHERQIITAYEKEVVQLAKKNMALRSTFNKETAGMSDAERDKAWTEFSNTFNSQVTTFSHNDSLSAFGALRNQGYIKMQSNVNGARYWKTMDMHHDSKLINGSKVKELKSYVKDGLAGKTLSKADQKKFDQYKIDESENVKYLKAQVLSDSLQNMMLPNVRVATSEIEKVLKQLEKSPGSKKSFKELERELKKLNRIVQKPGIISSAPAWRDAVLGKGYGDDDGNMKGRYGTAVSRAMRKMYLAQAEHANELGLTDQAKMFMSLSKNVSRMPGFDINKSISRIKYIQNAAVWKDAVVKGGVFGAMMNGTLWDMDFGPSRRVVSFNTSNLRFDEKSKKAVGGDMAFGYIVLPNDQLPLYNGLTSLYYTTPGAIIKTLLWNGEGFAYSAIMQNRSMKRNLAKSLNKNQNLLAQLKASGDFDKFITDSGGKLVFNAAMLKEGANLELLYNKFESLGGGFSKLAKMMKASSKQVALLQGLYNKFSKPSAIWKKTVDFIKGKALAPIGKLLRAFSTNSTWTSGVDNFIAGKLGLRQLAEIVAKKIVNLIASSVAGPIGTVLSFIFTELIMKALEPILAIGMWALRGALVIILLLILGISMIGLKQSPALPSYGISPTSTDYLYLEDDASGIECVGPYPDIALRPGQNCPVEPITGCTAGPEWH